MRKYLQIGDFYITVRAAITLICLTALIAYELIGGRTYFDEVLCLISIVYIFNLMISKKLSKYDNVSIMLLFVVVLIGLVSNIFSKLNGSIFSVLIDVVSEIKILCIFYAFKYFIDEDSKKDLVKIITPIGKIFCIGAFVCSIITQFVDIGMTGSGRYGLNGFKYFFPMTFQFLAVTLVIHAIFFSNKTMQNRKIYIFCSCISLMLATKSSPLLYSVILLILIFYFKKNENIKISTVIFIFIVVILLGSFQIETYLMNENAPRYLFFYYGAKTANTYFPLGSGFATFGSDQASRNYSLLYYRYGFNKLFGMNREDGSFLSDTFWPMGIGQFGWIGFFLYIMVYIRIAFDIKKQKLDEGEKAFAYACFAQYMIHAVGSAILSSSAGIIGFIALAIVLNKKK